MNNEPKTITITLSPSQSAALDKLSAIEGCAVERLAERGVDVFIATYTQASSAAALEGRLSKMHDHTVKLLVSVLKLVGQTLYFSSLPITTGPVKAKLNREGVSRQWQQSEKFVVDLLSPPPPAVTPKSK